jgi:hypothetical protein
MNKFIELKKQLMLIDPFIRLKRIKEILVHITVKRYRQELIELAKITINQLNQVREGEERFSLDSKLSQNFEESSEDKIERTMEEIAEEESNLSKKEEEILTDPIYGSSEESKKEVYGIIGNKDDSGDFYNSNESEPFYNSPEEDKKEKRFYF